MPQPPHGNSRESKKEHHLYEIFDKKEETTYKYGISGQPLNEDGSSPRANEQVSLFNRVVGWFRFIATVLITGIEGREEAEKLEQKKIDEYTSQNGKAPRGNP
jgi:hypothetical protein